MEEIAFLLFYNSQTIWYEIPFIWRDIKNIVTLVKKWLSAMALFQIKLRFRISGTKS